MKRSHILSLVFFLFSLAVYAQTPDQTLCYDETKNYSVDTAENGGEGTTGSTYTWTSSSTDAKISTNTTSGNKITIDWDTTPAGTYTLSVVETNNGCTGEPKKITVEILSELTAPTVTGGDVCSGQNGVFNIQGGTPNATVTYKINGGTEQTTTLDASGKGTVNIPAVTTEQTIQLTKITLGSCSINIDETATIKITSSPSAPTISTNAPICSSNEAIFTLTGTAGDEVTYTIDGGSTETITLDSNGKAEIKKDNATSDVTIKLIEIKAAGGCTGTISKTETITVTSVETTDIDFN